VLRFKECTLAKLDKMFQLREKPSLPALQSWLVGEAVVSDSERAVLVLIRERLIANVHDWNEEELSQFCIGPLLMLVNFTTRSFNVFAGRGLEGIVDGIELGGEPDGMIASGFRRPEKPYFYFQEYMLRFISPDAERIEDGEGDAAAKCLAAMLVAQTLNETEQPVYGCYVLGYSWSFMILQGREYAMSNAYLATRDDIFDIFRILKVLKRIITELVG